MKKLNLEITVGDKDECDNCMFRNAGYFSDDVGMCLLFNHPLRPVKEYGDTVGWEQCKSCREVCNRAKEVE